MKAVEFKVKWFTIRRIDTAVTQHSKKSQKLKTVDLIVGANVFTRILYWLLIFRRSQSNQYCKLCKNRAIKSCWEIHMLARLATSNPFLVKAIWQNIVTVTGQEQHYF